MKNAVLHFYKIFIKKVLQIETTNFVLIKIMTFVVKKQIIFKKNLDRVMFDCISVSLLCPYQQTRLTDSTSLMTSAWLQKLGDFRKFFWSLSKTHIYNRKWLWHYNERFLIWFGKGLGPPPCILEDKDWIAFDFYINAIGGVTSFSTWNRLNYISLLVFWNFYFFSKDDRKLVVLSPVLL